MPNEITVSSNNLGRFTIDMDLYDDEDSIIELIIEEAELDEDGDDDEICYSLRATGFAVVDADGLAAEFYNASTQTFDFDDFVEARDSGHDEDAIIAYMEWTGSWDKAHFEDSYEGETDSPAEFAHNLVEDVYGLGDMPDLVRHNIDWDGVAEDLSQDYYFADSGHVFRSC